MAERKLNASAAFQRPQELVLQVLKCQCQILPQFNLWMASTRMPKAANQAKEMTTSTVGFPCQLRIYHSALQSKESRHTWPREEARRERYQPYQTEQYGQAGNDFSIDPPCLWPCINIRELMQIVADNARDDLESPLSQLRSNYLIGQGVHTAAKAISATRRTMETRREMTGIVIYGRLLNQMVVEKLWFPF